MCSCRTLRVRPAKSATRSNAATLTPPAGSVQLCDRPTNTNPRNRSRRNVSVDQPTRVCPRPTQVPATPRLPNATLPEPSGSGLPQYESTSVAPPAQNFPRFESTSASSNAQGHPQYETASTDLYGQESGNSVVYESVGTVPIANEPLAQEPIVSGSVVFQPLPPGSQVYDARDQGEAPQEGPFSPMVRRPPPSPGSCRPHPPPPPPDPSRSAFCTATENVTGFNTDEISTDGIFGWPIAPVFARERFHPDINYQVIQKACMLATRFLEGTTAGFVFLHTVLTPYDPDDDEEYPDEVPNHELVPHPRYQAPDACPSAEDWQRVHGTLTRIAQHITIGFAETGNAAGTTSMGDEFVMIDASDAYYFTDGRCSHINLNIDFYYILNGIQQLPQVQRATSGAREVVETMLLAQTLLHEFAHALWYAARGEEVEAFWREERVAELGFCFTNLLFGNNIEIAAQAISLVPGAKEVYFYNHYGDPGRTSIISQQEVQIGAWERGILVGVVWPDYGIVGSYDSDESTSLRGVRGLPQRGEPMWAIDSMTRLPFSWIARYMTDAFWDTRSNMKDRTPDVFQYAGGPCMVRTISKMADGTRSFAVALVQ